MNFAKWMLGVLLVVLGTVASAEPLLANGIRGLQLGEAQAQTLRRAKEVWPGADLKCRRDGDYAVEVVRCVAYGSTSTALPYGGMHASMVSLTFKAAVLEMVTLQFVASTALQAYVTFQPALSQLVLARPTLEKNDAKGQRTLWIANDQMLVVQHDLDGTLATGHGQPVTFITYASVDFASESLRKSTQQEKGM